LKTGVREKKSSLLLIKKPLCQDTYDVSADFTEGKCEVNPFLEKMASAGMGAGNSDYF
jgi:hypothetical protein